MSAPEKPDLVKPVSDEKARGMFSGDAAGPVSLGQYWEQYRNKLRAGDVGSLPALLGLLLLLIVFTIAAPSTFLTTFNLANLLTQAGSICVLAMGIGFVLLLGHIDLSAGVIGGVGAGVMAMLMLKQGMPWYLAVAGRVAGRRGDGRLHRRAGVRCRYPVVRRHPGDIPCLPGCAAVDHRRPAAPCRSTMM